jgi:hypothetical protein
MRNRAGFSGTAPANRCRSQDEIAGGAGIVPETRGHARAVDPPFPLNQLHTG